MSSPIKIFDLSMTFPLGENGNPAKRREMELRAYAQISEDMKAQGFQIVNDTFRTIWETPSQGKATAQGIRFNGEAA